MMENRLKEIAHYLIKNDYKEQETGLLTGKMGKIIFFFHYSQHISKSLYQEYAEALLEDVYKRLPTEFFYDFRRGLCGTGWGFEYLLQNKFVIAPEEGDMFDELDEKICKLPFVESPAICTSKDIALYLIGRYNRKGRADFPSFEKTIVKKVNDTIAPQDPYINDFVKLPIGLIYNDMEVDIDLRYILLKEMRYERRLNPVCEGLQLLLALPNV